MEQTAQDINATLERFKKEGAHLLLPSTYISELPPYHKIVVDKVFLAADTDERDVYMQDKGYGQKQAKYAIARQGLMKLANAAGIMWDPARCIRLDDRRDRGYVAYQAVAGLKKIDGSPLFFKAEYDLDFEVIEDEITEGYENKRKGFDGSERDSGKWWHKMDEAAQDAYIDKCIRRDMLQKRKHKSKLAETGAMTRVVRALLNLKSTYTAKELEKPFIVVRTVFQPDYSDPDTKKALAEASVQAVAGVFGPARQLQLTDAPVNVTPVATTEFPDDIPEAPEAEPGDEAPEEPEGEGFPDPVTADFLTLSVEDRITTIAEAAKQRGIKDNRALWEFYQAETGKNPPKTVKKMPEEDMLKLWRALMALEIEAPKTEIPDDDIPF